MLAELLGEVGFELDDALIDAEHDVVLAVLSADHLAPILDAACLLAGAAPVVAILPMRDERVIRIALRRGAHACHSMDRSLEGLRALLGSLCAEAVR